MDHQHIPIFLIHQKLIQHYRVSIYNYLYKYLLKHGYKLHVVAKNVQPGNIESATFPLLKIELTFNNIRYLIKKHNPSAVILFVNLKSLYLFPLIGYLKAIRKKVVYWGHGIDLQDKNSKPKGIAYNVEHILCDAIILYAEKLRQYVSNKHKNKIFIANSTLNFEGIPEQSIERGKILEKYGISTRKNIILAGRLQKRKRIEDLIEAFQLLSDKTIGLILVGPDEDKIANAAKKISNNIYVTGPLYGKDMIDLLRASDIYCMPGAMGLSVVDALFCGLPVITEKVDHGPEIMYLKHGKNGFIVDVGDALAIVKKIKMLFENKILYNEFSHAAKTEIQTNGHISVMSKGFLDCLQFLNLKNKQ